LPKYGNNPNSNPELRGRGLRERPQPVEASQGWRALPQHYDDPAYSGDNLDRPALQQLLKDIDAGRIDVIVVYKIDRLTRRSPTSPSWSKPSMQSRSHL
jgi:hypothetical protein